MQRNPVLGPGRIPAASCRDSPRSPAVFLAGQARAGPRPHTGRETSRPTYMEYLCAVQEPVTPPEGLPVKSPQISVHLLKEDGSFAIFRAVERCSHDFLKA